MKNLLIIFLSFLIISCEQEPRWKSGNFTEEDVNWDTIDFESIRVNGHSIYTNEADIKKEFGEPLDSYNGYCFTHSQWKQSKRDTTFHSNIDFETIQIFKCNGITKIVLIDLFNSEIKVESSLGVLDKNTTLDEFKKVAPSSYSWRNLGLNSVMHGFREISEEDYNEGNVVVLFVHGGSKSSHDDIEVVFLNERLAYLIIPGIDLEYDKI